VFGCVTAVLAHVQTRGEMLNAVNVPFQFGIFLNTVKYIPCVGVSQYFEEGPGSAEAYSTVTMPIKRKKMTLDAAWQ
jgi:hypothetical protein